MFGQIIKKALLPAAAVVVESKIKTEVHNNECICRPSELPIYTPDQPRIVPLNEPQEPPSAIENAIRTTRETIMKYSDEISAYKRVAVEHFDKSKENVEWLVDYLQEEDNTMPKAGAVGIGALTGLIFGLRGGLFKKTIYATTGALGMGAVCYPKEAAEYSQIGLTEGKKYLTIAYNFIYGDGEQPREEQVNAPTTLDSPDPPPAPESRTKDPLSVVKELRDEATSKACHCPIGACLGRSGQEAAGVSEAQAQTEVAA